MGGYDYGECEINPLYHLDTSVDLKQGKQRPQWSFFGQAKHHMEPILFTEKFVDWPDATRLIKLKEKDNCRKEDKRRRNDTDNGQLTPYNAESMMENRLDDPDLELEGSHLGRGVEYYDEAERRLHKISTQSVKMWHIVDYELVAQDKAASLGQFHCGDTYVIRWQYRLTVTGRDLKGQASNHGVLGRDRFCYFLWIGCQAPPADQGASALNTRELDEERGPQMRIVQGHEPPAFLSLFQGRMAIHDEKWTADDGSPWRLYYVRGETEAEANLLQVRRGVVALRSRGSLLLVNPTTAIVYIWYGAKSLKHCRCVAAAAAAALKLHKPPEMGFQDDAVVTIKEQYEGAESRDFWSGMGAAEDRSLYLSLSHSSIRYDFTPRLFQLTSWTGLFSVEEIASPSRMPQLPCSYPFLQDELYGANQPTLFMLDNEEEVWLWQGWWPDDEETKNVTTGSSQLRWATERRCAFETVLDYCRLKREDNPPAAYLVSAGLEPLAFTCLFPDWVPHEHAAHLNIQVFIVD